MTTEETLVGIIKKRYTGIDTHENAIPIWSFVLTVMLGDHHVSVAKASYFQEPNDVTGSFINERSALYAIKTAASTLAIDIFNLKDFEPRCHACTSHVLSEENEGELLCLTCGEVGPRDWFMAGSIAHG